MQLVNIPAVAESKDNVPKQNRNIEVDARGCHQGARQGTEASGTPSAQAAEMPSLGQQRQWRKPGTAVLLRARQKSLGDQQWQEERCNQANWAQEEQAITKPAAVRARVSGEGVHQEHGPEL